jgi:hypothetical protein
MWVRRNDAAFDSWLLGGLTLGALLCCISGWRQRFGGLAATRAFLEEQALREGRVLSEVMRQKLGQKRVFGPFVYPNSFAAHVILTGPVLLLSLWRFGSRCEPVRLSRALFVGVGGILVTGALVFSGSRGAVLGLQCGIGVGILSLPSLRRWRWPILGGVLVAGAGALFWLSLDRSLLSASARLDYYATALRIFRAHPFTGAGLGEFLNSYLRMKPVGAEETRVAHNMVLGLLAQAGVLAGLAAAVCLAVPALFGLAWLPGGRTDDVPLKLCAVVGAVAWGGHALLDFNIQIPGTVATAALLGILCTAPGAPAGDQEQSTRRGQYLPRLAAALLGLLAFAGIWRLPGEKAFQEMTNSAGRLSPRRLRTRARDVSALLPTSPLPWLLFARVAEYAERPYLAIEGFEQAAARSPNRSLLYAHLAENHLQLDDVAAARKAAQRAVELYPGSPAGLYYSALTEMLARDTASGAARRMRTVRTALAASPHVIAGGHEVVVTLDWRGREADTTGRGEAARLCDRLNEVELSYQGYRGPMPVRFEPVAARDR